MINVVYVDNTCVPLGYLSYDTGYCTLFRLYIYSLFVTKQYLHSRYGVFMYYSSVVEYVRVRYDDTVTS